MSVTRRLMMAAGAAAIGFASLTGVARAWEPTKPIDFVIMAGAGGGADQIARFIQSVVEKHSLSPRPLVPNNKGGGSGAEALIALKGASDPDHTILVTLNSFFTTPLRQPNLGIDTMSFTPIQMMGVDPFVLWVHKDSGITTFEQWVETVKGANGEYVTGGTGTGQEDSIVFAYTMARDGTTISASLATVEMAPAGTGTRLTLTEQGAFLDGRDKVEHRETGWRALLDTLETALAG